MRWQRTGQGFESPQLHYPFEPKGPVRIGSNEFRNRFGPYLERAAAGGEVHMGRHGRRLAGLPPATESPEQPERRLITPA